MKSKIKKYFKRNPGAIFVLAFQILLIAAAITPIDGNQSLTNEIAIYGYYSLVVGIMLQFITFLREG
ncbi:MAG: hypothetical protein ACE5OW_02285 [Candidatus Bathyarchaeia archaeon]